MAECDLSLPALNAKVDGNDRRYGERFRAQEVALDKAEAATETRLHNLNEFRAQLRDQNATFVTQVELDAITKIVDAKLSALRSEMDVYKGVIVAAAAAATLIGWIIPLFTKN